MCKEQKAIGNGMQLHSMNKSDGNKIETNINAKFIIHDFEQSLNGQVITEEICMENKETLIGQPVLVKYYNEGEKDKDHLGTHEVYITKNRDTGEDLMATNTIAIGTFQKSEIEDVNINGKNQRCLVGYAQLWLDRYYNICSLLNEWLGKGIQIFCSCEYTYRNYEMIDNVQYIKSPYSYTGHTILNSEEKDGFGTVLPAYDSAAMVSWNAALKKDEEKNSKNCEDKQLENVFLKSLNESISLGDTRRGIFDALANVMTAAEYEYMWLSDYDIYDDFFVYETYDGEKWKYYKCGYSKTDSGINVDYTNKTEVEYKVEMVEVSKANEQLLNAVDKVKIELEETITGLNSTISNKEIEIGTLKQDNLSQKETVISLNEKITELNEVVGKLSEYKEKYETEKYKKAINEAKQSYEAKFAKLNAIEKYESEEVQKLIVDTLDDEDEKALNAKTQLTDMLLSLVDTESIAQKSVNSKNTKGIVEPGGLLGGLNSNTKPKAVIKDIELYGLNEIE